MFRAPVFTGHTTLSSTPYRQLENQAPNTTGSNHLYNTLELPMMGIIVPETCWSSNKICNKNHLLHLVGILFPHTKGKVKRQSIYSVLQKKKHIFPVFCTWTHYMAPLAAFSAFGPLFAAPVSRIQPWTAQALAVTIWILFISLYETGLLTIFGVWRRWLRCSLPFLHLVFTTSKWNASVNRTGPSLLLQPYFGRRFPPISSLFLL